MSPQPHKTADRWSRTSAGWREITLARRRRRLHSRRCRCTCLRVCAFATSKRPVRGTSGCRQADVLPARHRGGVDPCRGPVGVRGRGCRWRGQLRGHDLPRRSRCPHGRDRWPWARAATSARRTPTVYARRYTAIPTATSWRSAALRSKPVPRPDGPKPSDLGPRKRARSIRVTASQRQPGAEPSTYDTSRVTRPTATASSVHRRMDPTPNTHTVSRAT